MSDIIKNIFGNKQEATKPIKASKFCGICQEAFSRDKKDNFKLDYCAECHSTNKISAVAYWKNHFAITQANTLPPNLAKLKEKLAQNRSLVEGNHLSRVANVNGLERSLRDISASQSEVAVPLETVREQVANLLPSVLAEMGLEDKVDANLLVDAIVPIKIASPIVNLVSGKNVLRSIVAETLSNLNMDKALQKEALVKAHGKVANLDSKMILNEGLHRVSSDYGYRIRQLANPLNQMQLGEQLDPAQTPMMPPVNPDEVMGDFAPPEDDNQEGKGEVVHLPDDEANQMIQEKSMSAPVDPTSGDMAAEPPPDMLNEGIGTYSGDGEAQVPDASEMEDAPQEGGVKRIESSVADFISRRVQEKKAALKRPPNAELFMFAGKLQANVPSQIVRLAEKDLNVIDSHPPLNYMTAAYSDGSKKTFKCYATDRGYLFVNDNFSVHSVSQNKFAEFIQSDSSFRKWAFLPEPDMEAPGNPMAPDHDIEDMAVPQAPEDTDVTFDMESSEAPVGKGDPGFNEIKETHLNSSPNNHISGGMGDDQQAIFDNGNPGVGGPELDQNGGNPLGDNPEETLLDEATNLLPKIEKMFPDDTPEAQQNMAIEAALNLIEAKLKKKASDVGTWVSNTDKGELRPHQKLLAKITGIGNDLAGHFNKPLVQNTGEVDGYGMFRPGDEINTQKLKQTTRVQPLSPTQKNTPTSKSRINPPSQTALPSTNQTSLNSAPSPGGALHLTNTQPKALPPAPNQLALAASLNNKAKSLMPYINATYASESLAVRQNLALEAAKILVIAEPVAEAPAAPAPVKVPGKVGRPKGSVKKPLLPVQDQKQDTMAEPDGIDGTGNGYEKGSPARLRRTLDKFWSTDMYAGASKVDEIRKITAGMTLDEFELSVEALLDFGYTDKQIMQTFEKIAECDDVFGSTGAVAAVAKTFGETSEASKHGLR